MWREDAERKKEGHWCMGGSAAKRKVDCVCELGKGNHREGKRRLGRKIFSCFDGAPEELSFPKKKRGTQTTKVNYTRMVCPAADESK